MNWTKVCKGNDWEAVFYHLEGAPNPFRAKMDLREGEAWRVRFPDGHEEMLPLIARKRRASYSDHGHRSEVTSNEYGVAQSVHGIPVFIDLEGLEVLA